MRERLDDDLDTPGAIRALDEAADTGVEYPLTEFEVTDGTGGEVHGDEIELDLDDVLTTGRTVTEAPEGD